MSRLGQAAKAVKAALPAKVLIAGPSGSGKTFTSLVLAERLAGDDGKVLVIDTEHGRASLYADLSSFDSLKWLAPYDPRELAETLVDAAAKYVVVVIDSTSHFWFGDGGTLDIVDDAAKQARGNSYAGWKTGTPAQNSLYEAVLAAPCHVVATVRSKTEYVLETDGRGKQVPRKVGMAPVQRDGVEYEFDLQLDLDHEHSCIVGKTRCPNLADKVFAKNEVTKWSAILIEWLDSGERPEPVACPVDCGFAALDKATVATHLIEAHGWSVVDGKVRPPAPEAAAPPDAEPAPAGFPPFGDPDETDMPPVEDRPSEPARKRLYALLRDAGAPSDGDAMRAWASSVLGREVLSRKSFTRAEVKLLSERAAAGDVPVMVP